MELSIALNRYDLHVPFFNGTVAAPEAKKRFIVKGLSLRLES